MSLAMFNNQVDVIKKKKGTDLLVITKHLFFLYKFINLSSCCVLQFTTWIWATRNIVTYNNKKKSRKKKRRTKRRNRERRCFKDYMPLGKFLVFYNVVYSMLLNLPCVHKFLCWISLKPQNELLYVFIDFLLNKFLKIRQRLWFPLYREETKALD